MSRVYNFSAGPAVLPEEVLKEAQEEMLDYRGCGMSVMEMSHRSRVFQDILAEAEADLRTLMHIPENYKVLFVQGGGTVQFAMVPMNLMQNKAADYIVTGQFAKKAWKEAQLFGQANKVASSEDKNFTYIPDCSDLPIGENSDYVYICENNTIYGTKFKTLPNTKGKPLVADVSSCFLSEPVKVTDYGMLYGGAQKNLAPAGVTFAIIREDMLDRIQRDLPTMVDYRTHVANNSMFNTPPVFAIYALTETLNWLKSIGGVPEIYRRNQEKAALLYDEIDRNPLFVGTATEEDRSLMNICFVMADGYEELAPEFLEFAKSQGMVGIKGHRLVGGFRASCHNALPKESVEAPVACPEKEKRI